MIPPRDAEGRPARLAIQSPPPAVTPAAVARCVRDHYGLEGRFAPLVSERDHNLRLDTPAGESFVVKIANPVEDPASTAFQVAVLQHLERTACSVPVPRVVPTRDGASTASIEADGRRCVVRVVTWLAGRPMTGRAPDARLGFELGRSLARLDIALRGFSHPGDSPQLLWDMQRAAELRDLLEFTADTDLRDRTGACLDDFERRVAPRLASLRRQVIHNDLNPGNVLLAGNEPPRVAGVIDFGDMLRAPLVVDVAIAAAYARGRGPDPLAPALALVAGFDELVPLDDVELGLLYDLVRARLAATIAILHWRRAMRGADDAYLCATVAGESGAGRFLSQVERAGRDGFTAGVAAACRRETSNL